jgi:hypothetical protein
MRRKREIFLVFFLILSAFLRDAGSHAAHFTPLPQAGQNVVSDVQADGSGKHFRLVNLQYRRDSSGLPRLIEKRHKKTRVCKVFKAEHVKDCLPYYGPSGSYRYDVCGLALSFYKLQKTLRGPPAVC